MSFGGCTHHLKQDDVVVMLRHFLCLDVFAQAEAVTFFSVTSDQSFLIY